MEELHRVERCADLQVDYHRLQVAEFVKVESFLGIFFYFLLVFVTINSLKPVAAESPNVRKINFYFAIKVLQKTFKLIKVL